jgi:hypothetical protein
VPRRCGVPAVHRCPPGRRRRRVVPLAGTARLRECCPTWGVIGRAGFPPPPTAECESAGGRDEPGLSMKFTWSMQTVRKNCVDSASASSLKAPRPSGSLRRGTSQLECSLLYSWTLRARPRATDQTAPLSSLSSIMAWDISRATRPLPSMNGCIHRRRWWAAAVEMMDYVLPALP